MSFNVREVTMLNKAYESNLAILYTAIFILIVGAAIFGARIGARRRTTDGGASDIGTLTGAALGLLALLLAFSFSLALSRYEARRTQVLEEANAIGSAGNFALMLPKQVQKPILDLLRDYTEVRIGLGIPYNPAKLEQDTQRSLDLQGKLWPQAVNVTAAAPQSLPVYRFVGSLNEINNIHESRPTALRYHVPAEIMFMLVGVAMVAMGFTGYHSGIAGARRPTATIVMSLTIATVLMLVIDLDRPARGLIQVPTLPLVDTLHGLPR
jgi:hypothetical protein